MANSEQNIPSISHLYKETIYDLEEEEEQREEETIMIIKPNSEEDRYDPSARRRRPPPPRLHRRNGDKPTADRPTTERAHAAAAAHTGLPCQLLPRRVACSHLMLK